MDFIRKFKGFCKARKLRNRLLFCYEAMALVPDEEYLNIIYDDNYSKNQRKKDNQLARSSKYKRFRRIVLSENKIEMHLHLVGRPDEDIYKKWECVEEFLKSVINRRVNQFMAALPYASLEQNYIRQKSNALDQAIFIQEIEDKILKSRDDFFLSKKFEKIISKFRMS